MSGKGDTPRPLSVPSSVYAERWERTFGWKNGLVPVTSPSILTFVDVPSELHALNAQQAEANADAQNTNEESGQ